MVVVYYQRRKKFGGILEEEAPAEAEVPGEGVDGVEGFHAAGKQQGGGS